MLTILTLLTLAGTARPAHAGDDLECAYCLRARLEAAPLAPVDPETGRDLRAYPPHRLVDYTHMRLDLTIRDMNLPRMEAVQTLAFEPIGRDVSELRLDARFLDIQDVRVEGGPAREATFTHDGLTLAITFSPPIAPGEATTIVTRYRVNDPRYGLLWTLPSPAWPGRAPQIHTQGQPETNQYWFPCHDSPNERLTTEILVNVPRGYVASSNGRLVSRKPGRFPGGAGEAMETFHWLQDSDHVNYLVSLVVGKFDVVDVGTGSLPMNVYVPPGRGADALATYARTPKMVEVFSGLVDEPYPWAKYSQLVVWNFGWGGMENTSATTMYDTAVLSPGALVEHDLDGLISHELAHQWFGDLITCNSWEHVWLNEGFATYFTALWFEARDGEDAYQASVLGNFDGVTGRDRPEAPHQPGLVSKNYRDPWEVFQKAANPYPKGASVLHMLRQRLGDEVFFDGLAAYVDAHRHTTAETADLRKALERASGESLEQFFAQWCLRPGVPALLVTPTWDSGSRSMSVRVEQTQNIDADNPAFEFDLPIWFTLPGEGSPVRGVVAVRGRDTTASFPLAGEPAIVAVDPQSAVLSTVQVEQPAARTLAQLERGPTLASRVRAARALESPELGEARAASAALSRVAWNRANHRTLRLAAIRALERRGAIDDAFAPMDDDPHVREGAVDAIAARAGRDAEFRARVLPSLAAIAAYENPDGTVRERCAALRALGSLASSEHRHVLIDALGVESQHDSVRQAAIEALGRLGGKESLAALMPYVGPASYSRTRATAISTVASLASADPDAAMVALTPLLNDRDRRAWRAAGQALVEVGDSRAMAALTAYRAATNDPTDHAQVDRWTAALTEKLRGSP